MRGLLSATVTIAGTVASPTAAVQATLAGTRTITGTLASPIAAAQGALVGTETFAGTLASPIAAVQSTIVGDKLAPGAQTGVLASPIAAAQASLQGTVTIAGTLAATGSGVRSTIVATGTYAGVLASPIGAVRSLLTEGTGTVVTGILAATVPAMRSRMTAGLYEVITGIPPLSTSDVDICNRALFMLGEDEILSLTDFGDSDRAKVCSALYPMVRAECLAKYPWRWATRKQQLTRETLAPVNEWRYHYVLPSDSVRLVAIYKSGMVGARPIQDYERMGPRIMTNEESLWADYVYARHESTWPPVFESYVSACLASRLAIAITGKVNLSERFDVMAHGLPQERGEGGIYAQAKAADAYESPPHRVQHFTLLDARAGGFR